MNATKNLPKKSDDFPMLWDVLCDIASSNESVEQLMYALYNAHGGYIGMRDMHPLFDSDLEGLSLEESYKYLLATKGAWPKEHDKYAEVGLGDDELVVSLLLESIGVKIAKLGLNENGELEDCGDYWAYGTHILSAIDCIVNACERYLGNSEVHISLAEGSL